MFPESVSLRRGSIPDHREVPGNSRDEPASSVPVPPVFHFDAPEALPKTGLFPVKDANVDFES